jgi:catechol 2,3-dioxygenase-like lactoylglutathione lyase family enzyme
MGHVHLIVKDLRASKQLWLKVLGATPASHASLDGVCMPGMYVWFKKVEPAGGTDGSTIRDLGLRVSNLGAVLLRAVRAGLHCRGTSRSSAHLIVPENVLLELTEDSQMSSDVAADHIHLIVRDVMTARQWYEKRFGGSIPGIRLDFIQSDTRERVVDHIGFEVASLQAYTKGLESAGTRFEIEPQDVPDLKLKLAFLVDPWGTRIELTEGLERNPQ